MHQLGLGGEFKQRRKGELRSFKGLLNRLRFHVSMARYVDLTFTKQICCNMPLLCFVYQPISTNVV